jgi:hypothetical protein
VKGSKSVEPVALVLAPLALGLLALEAQALLLGSGLGAAHTFTLLALFAFEPQTLLFGGQLGAP